MIRGWIAFDAVRRATVSDRITWGVLVDAFGWLISVGGNELRKGHKRVRWLQRLQESPVGGCLPVLVSGVSEDSRGLA